jgi:signal transduction histidine kinase
MPGQHQRDPIVGRAELAAGLHDVSAGLAIGIGLLKASDETAGGARALGVVIAAFEESLAELRRLSHRIGDRSTSKRRRTDLRDSLRREARMAGIALELELIGDDGWLAADQDELILMTAREAIRNVKRHAGSASCHITVDLSDCPFVLRARDWGAGIVPGAQTGDGIETLRELAVAMGCELSVRSQPGLGTELTLVGRYCPRARQKPTELKGGDLGLRSVGAEESLSSRRRVAARRPFGDSGQQITQV